VNTRSQHSTHSETTIQVASIRISFIKNRIFSASKHVCWRV